MSFFTTILIKTRESIRKNEAIRKNVSIWEARSVFKTQRFYVGPFWSKLVSTMTTEAFENGNENYV